LKQSVLKTLSSIWCKITTFLINARPPRKLFNYFRHNATLFQRRGRTMRNPLFVLRHPENSDGRPMELPAALMTRWGAFCQFPDLKFAIVEGRGNPRTAVMAEHAVITGISFAATLQAMVRACMWMSIYLYWLDSERLISFR
jgi:hypothetical protein